MTSPRPVATVWNYAYLAALAEGVESKIANLPGVADLLPAYQSARLAEDLHVRRAWAEVAPAAGLRAFGDCRQVLALQALAADDLASLIGPEPSQPEPEKT